MYKTTENNTCIETERLILAELSKEDSPFILELLNTPSWIRYIGDRNIRTLQDATDYILNGPQKSYEENGFGLFLVKIKNEDLPIGICGLIKRDYLNNPDIGFAFLPQYEGKGYAEEAAKSTLLYAKEIHQINNVSAITIKENTRSIKLLEKIGMQFEKSIHEPLTQEELLLFTLNL